MKIISWNLNGIRSRIFNDKTSSQIKKINFISPDESSPINKLITEHDPDIFCFQETRCNAVRGSEFVISGYKSYFNESKLDGSRSGDRYSGTAIYYKETMDCINVDINISGYEDLEGRIIIMYFKEFTIINVYAPNSGTNYKNKILFMDYMIKFLNSQEMPVIFCGDMNIAIDTHFDKTKVKPGPGFYKHELDFHNNLKTIGYIDSISPDDEIIYTWWDPRQRKEEGLSIVRNRNKGWRLDYFFTRNFGENNRISSKSLKYIGENKFIPCASDHAPVLLSVSQIPSTS